MSKYRKATAEELASIGYVPNQNRYAHHINFAKMYYPGNAVTMIMTIDSEYNDSTYDNSLKYIVVLDKDGNELPPLKATAKKCREEWNNIPIPGTYSGVYSGCESNEEMNSEVVIPLKMELPEFYVKIDE